MRQIIDSEMLRLAAEGNMRHIPTDNLPSGIVDLSSNDYLGIASRSDLQEEFLASAASAFPMSASASRLLAGVQTPFASLEHTLAEAYGSGRAALLFNSGYHANTGLIPPLCNRNTMILADRLVHASIIDGIKLSGARFTRFRHNDTAQLKSLLEKCKAEHNEAFIIIESVYSMDGDRAPIEEIARLKRELAPDGWLYVDEAHAIGVEGTAGLGLAKETAGTDVIVGTFGKALASAGAFAILSPTLREWMVNRCRSLIFSTALPPLQTAWTEWIFKKAIAMDTEREHLRKLSKLLADILHRHGATDTRPGHIRPLITGNPTTAVSLSLFLRNEGFNVLPIRRPTVPPGTDRLRFSLSSAITPKQLAALDAALDKVI